MLISITLILFIAYLLFLSSYVQTFLSKKIADNLSSQTNTPIHVEGVDFSPFKNLIIRGLYVEDYKQDTLFYVDELKAKVDSFNIKKKRLYFKKITLDKTFINLYGNENHELNLIFFTDSLFKDSVKSDNDAWKFWVSDVEFKKSRFAYRNYEAESKDFGMNYDDIYVTDIDFLAKNIKLQNDTLDFYTAKFSCVEKSGFVVSNFKGHNKITSRQWALFDVSIFSPHSKISAESLYFNYISGKHYWRDFTKKMKIDFKFKSSRISFVDVAFFNEHLRGFREIGSLSGQFYGTIYDLKGKDINIEYNDDTRIRGRFYMNGLPYLSKSYLEVDFKELTTSIADVESIYIPGYSSKYISLPDKFDNLGLIEYQGKFNGFINDFVFYGDWKTKRGILKTDIALKPTAGESKLSFKGDVKTTKFDLGGFFQQERIGDISMNVDVNGLLFDNGIQGKLRGVVDSLDFYDYVYKNLTLNGEFSENKFDGKVSVLDPNIGFDFGGKIDFSQEIPTVNFNSHVTNAKLYPLHLSTFNDLSDLSFVLNANFTGSDFDNINGVVEVSSARYNNHLGGFVLDSITLNAGTTPSLKKIELKSDFADAQVYGNYDIRQLLSSLQNMVYYYLPAYADNEEYAKLDSINNFRFDIDLKKSLPITKVLYPFLEIADSSKISGRVNAKNHQLNINVTSPYLTWFGRSLDNVNGEILADNEKLILEGNVKSFIFNDNFRLHNISQKFIVEKNKINLDLSWNNKDTIGYSGELFAEGRISRENKDANPLTEINLLSSKIVMADSIWNIEPSEIIIDSTSLQVNNFKISRKEQFFALNGKFSEIPQDSLFFMFQDISLKNLNYMMNNSQFDFDGNINGYVQISDFYHDRVSTSSLSIADLKFNTDTIGDLHFNSDWDKFNQKLSVSSFISYKGEKELNVSGYYFPKIDSLNFNASINDFRLSLLHPYIPNSISKFSGFTHGNIRVTGTTKSPKLFGKVYLEDTHLKISELQTEYVCNDSIQLTPNQIRFKNFKMFDSQGKQAKLNGFIQHENFENTQFNLNLGFTDFNILDTKILDNESFYGEAYMTGITHLTGTPDNLKIDISAKTEKNTRLYVPLNTKSDIKESNFITFVKMDSISSIIQEEYDAKLSGIRMNCDLDITPETDIQIILDSKVGDIIRTKGDGSLRLEIDTKGDFKIFGDYTIVEGDYLFTLQDVINKKFDLENGGTIKWDGDPYNATIDISAVYNVKTALYDLLLNTPNINSTKKVPVQCKLSLSNYLQNPNILFSIEFPTLDQQTQSILNSLFTSEDEVNKQILSLLVLNRFYTPEYLRATDPDFENKNSNYAVGITASELLSNQFSRWLSQISNDFDIGFIYRPGDQITSDEIELALSTQIFNDKVTLNGNVGTGSNQKQNKDIVGDFDVNVKLDKKGKLQLKAFTRSNEKLLYEDNRNTQGVGVFYRESFDSFSKLLKKYLKLLQQKEDQ